MLAAVVAAACHNLARTNEPTYTVQAIRFGTLAKFPVRSLIRGADTARRIDVTTMVWAVRGGDRTILVDAGFYRQKFVDRWKPVDFVRPSDAVRSAGIDPASVTDIVLSHIHWDHADGADLFPNATVWLQREEYAHYIGANGEVLDPAIDPDVALMLHKLKAAGRVRLIEGDAQSPFPGITVYTGGKHTFASEYVGVRTAERTIVLASDNAYLYENLEQHRPIAQTLDSISNLAAQDRMRAIAGDLMWVVPGHDPQVFVRFPGGKIQ